MLTKMNGPITEASPENHTPAAQAKRAGARLLRGRTKARLADLTAELAAAQQAHTEAVQRLAVRIADDLEIGDAQTELTHAAEKLKALEAAVALAKERDETAANALADSEEAVRGAAEFEAIKQLKRVAVKVDHLFIETERLIVEELKPAIDAVCAVIPPGVERNFVVKIVEGFDLHFLKAARTIIPRGRAHVVLLGAQRYSDLVPEAETIRTRKR
jgi:hypothetical protein